MTVFWFQIGLTIMIAVTGIFIMAVNNQLEKQKTTVCYLGMAVTDILYAASIGLCFLRLFGLV